jgi:hypothetical protein
MFLIPNFPCNFVYLVVCYMIKKSPIWGTGAHSASLKKDMYVVCVLVEDWRFVLQNKHL